MNQVNTEQNYLIDFSYVELLHKDLENLFLRQNKLSQNLTFYKTLINPPNTIIYINDFIKRCKLWSNDNYEKITGYTLKEANAMGEDYFKIAYHPKDQHLFNSAIKLAQEHPKQNKHVAVYRFKTKQGPYIWFYSFSSIIKYTEDKKPWLSLGVGLKLADEQKYEENLNKLMQENVALRYKAYRKLLTTREKSIMIWLGKGYTSIQIAEKLNLSHYTVETHRKNLMKKLEVKNTAALMRLMSMLNVES